MSLNAHLYVGDYFADTLVFTAREHVALRLLLLETWMRSPVGNVRLAKVAGLSREEWRIVKPAVLPLLRSVQPRITESLNHIRTFDGQRLPRADWDVVRSIIFERDGYTCTYCGSRKQLEADHIVPLSCGGSNAFENLVTACRPCNLSKGPKTVKDWRDFVRPLPRKSRRQTRSKVRCHAWPDREIDRALPVRSPNAEELPVDLRTAPDSARANVLGAGPGR